MSKYEIIGGKRLCGKVRVQGAKNSALPILAATVLCEGKSILHNCPQLSDVYTSVNILKHLGCCCDIRDNTVTVDTSELTCSHIPDELMREMRSSIVFLGAILGKCGNAVISSPGGCELGPRPIDLHISSLKKMGATINEAHGLIEFTAPNGLLGTDINLSFASVGATENIILAAVTARGKTVIHNAAKEPEIVDLANFLNRCGAKINGAGSDKIIIDGVVKLKGCTHAIIPDRIVAASFMSAAAITGGEIVLENVIPSHLASVNSVFEESGCNITCKDDAIIISAPKKLNRISCIRTTIYPGFPTDAGPLVLSALCCARGTTVFVENIFENRFRYIDELKRFGANIKTEGKVAIVEGVKSLSAAPCRCTDLRGGAALIIAGLAANGKSVISDIHHVLRGYEKFDEYLSSLGANIKVIS